MEEHSNVPEPAPSNEDELRDLAPRPVADQADGSEAEVKGGNANQYLTYTIKEVRISGV